MNDEVASSGPRRDPFSADDEHYQLYRDVREAISSLLIYFRTETHISGIMATDLHTLNTVLGATIEQQVVHTPRRQTRSSIDRAPMAAATSDDWHVPE